MSDLITGVVPQTFNICLLGLVDTLQAPRAVRTLVGVLLFYARKVIVLKWKSAFPPTLGVWKGLVNAVVLLYKAAYTSRGFSLYEFEKVWHLWVNSSLTTDVQD